MRGHPTRARSGGRRAARAHLVLAVWVAQELVFSEDRKFFSTEGIRSPQHQISPRQQNLTLPLLQSISALSLDGMWREICVCHLCHRGSSFWRTGSSLGGGRRPACSLAALLAASLSLIGDGGLFGCPQVPRQQLRWRHWLACICRPGNELPALPAPRGQQQSGAACKKIGKRKKKIRQKKGEGAGSLPSCQLEIQLPMLPHQGSDSSSAGDATVMLGRGGHKHPLATG